MSKTSRRYNSSFLYWHDPGYIFTWICFQLWVPVFLRRVTWCHSDVSMTAVFTAWSPCQFWQGDRVFHCLAALSCSFFLFLKQWGKQLFVFGRYISTQHQIGLVKNLCVFGMKPSINNQQSQLTVLFAATEFNFTHFKELNFRNVKRILADLPLRTAFSEGDHLSAA